MSTGPLEMKAPVERVTVFEDRAQVRRAMRLELAPGVHSLRVSQVTPLVVDRSLRGAVSGPVQLLQLRVRRESTVRAARPEVQRELGEEIDRLKQSYLVEHHRQRAAEAEQRLLERAIPEWLQACSIEAGRGVAGRRTAWSSGLQRLEERLATVIGEIQQAREAAEDLAERLEQLGERLFLAMQPTSLYWGHLEATVEVTAPGACQLWLDYLVPCALWRPVHRAELGEELRWVCGGMIWQRTGEDWDGVRLCLSTARPTAGGKLPIIEEDLLRLRQKTEAEQAAISVELRDETISALAPVAPGEAAPRVPGVDDGGEVRRFEPGEPVRIPSDGRAHLVELGSFTSQVALDALCYPELSGQVVLRSRQTNTGRQPLLAGPVTLVRRGGFSGRSLCTYAGPGEAFEVGWGTLDAVQVVRRTDDKEEDLSLGRGHRRRTRIRLFLSNIGAEAQRVQIVERIPVSELSEVKVKVIDSETSPGARPDVHGHLRWELELLPSSHRELTLVYEVDSSRRVAWS